MREESPIKDNGITPSELKVIQMDVLQAIDEFCGVNNIKYSLACGTLLGAARHKGYIPWDDDIDIYIPRADYLRLMRLFPDVYKGRYKLVSIERDRKWDRTSAKAYDIFTSFYEPGQSYHLGVNIDIFPIDDVPDNEKEWNSFDKKRTFINKLLDNGRYSKVSINRFSCKRLFIQLFFCLVSCRQLAELLNKYVQQFNKCNYSRCFESCTAVLVKNPFPKALFDDLILLPFEDREYYVFADYDTYLTASYGNWRELPPEEKRVSHHIYKATWK